MFKVWSSTPKIWKKNIDESYQYEIDSSNTHILANGSIVKCEVDSQNELNINNKSSITKPSSNNEIQSQSFANISGTNYIYLFHICVYIYALQC